MEKLGIAIIGGGPAGLAAGIYAVRGGADVKLFEELFPGGQIVKTHRVENYPGFTGGPDGYALAAALEKHASEFDLPVIYGAVTDLKLTEGEKTFAVNGEEYAADAVILAMGAGPRKLGHPDEDRFVGAGVSYCATCDGNFYRNKDVAIVGGGDTAVSDALYLSGLCRKVYLIHRRDQFRAAATLVDRVKRAENVELVRAEAREIPEGEVVVATGPLSSDAIAERIAALCPDSDLHFYDAVAPIVTLESVDMSSAFFASRYDKGTADYVNCPMDRDEYLAFVKELVSAREAEVHGFDDGGVFEGCMPVEVMARRGVDTLRYGPLKPVGLKDPRTGKESYAVVQLRRDNAEGTLYNLVGFQTHLTWGEQKRVFSMIPALKNAEFVRYGVMHRNTYLDSPKLLDRYYRLKREPRIRFAGQMTGVEGYVESCASGALVGIETAAEALGLDAVDFPQETAIGALGLYVSGGSVGDFQPMNINFGIIKELGYRVKGKRNKNAAISERSLQLLDRLMTEKEVLKK